MTEEHCDNGNYISSVDPGTDFGRGRGFVPLKYEHKVGNAEDGAVDNPGSSIHAENNGFNACGSKRQSLERGWEGNTEQRGRGHGRGGRGGRRGPSHNDGGGHKSRRGDGRRGGITEKPREAYIPPEPVDDDSMFAGGISTGTNFDKYDIMQVNVTGENVPIPIKRFEDSGLRQLLLDNIHKSGYVRPTPVQKHAIPIVTAGRDLMACAQTGSGKTAAFLLPIIHVLLNDRKELVVTTDRCEPQVVILSPTRELALQISTEARKFAHGSIIKTGVVYGGVVSNHQIQRCMTGCHILVATPGRLLDFVNKGQITFSSLRFLVLDEADRMLDMGFMPDIECLMEHPTMVASDKRQTLMFSATFPEEIQRLAGKFLNNYLFLAVGIVGSACSDVEQHFHLVPKFEKRLKLTELITKEGCEKTLVFVEQRRTADFIATYLSDNDFPTTSIHGDRLQRQREEALADFKSGRMGVLVATAVAARGLDIKNVYHVINYDMPHSIDEYVHRIGRTGRVGNRGKATSFYDPEVDALIARDLIKILQQAEQVIPSWLKEAASNAVNISSYTRPSHFGGKDFRKFEHKTDGSKSTLAPLSDGSYNEPQPLEPEEEW